MTGCFRAMPLMMIAALIGLSSAAHAALLVSESFDYSPAGASLGGANGGTGFKAGSSWAASSSPIVASQGLTHPLMSGESGLAFTVATNTTGGIKRDIDTTPFLPALGGYSFGDAQADGTIWISYLHQLHNAYSYIFFGSDTIGTTSTDTTHYRITDIGHTGGGSYTLTNDETYLILISIKFNAGAPDLISLWVLPSSATSLTLGAPVDSYSVNITPFTKIQLATIAAPSAYATFDELRIGTDLASVVPEPASVALLTILLSGLTIRRRLTASTI